MLSLGLGLGIPFGGGSGAAPLPTSQEIQGDGDSRNAQPGPGSGTQSWLTQLAAATGKSVFNAAVSGDTLQTRTSQYPTAIAPLYNAVSRNTLFCNALINDLRNGANATTCWNRLLAYRTLASNTGWKLYFQTPFPNGEGTWTGAMEAERQSLLSMMRANPSAFCDALIDNDAIPALAGAIAQPTGPYQADRLHLMNRGNWLLSEQVRQQCGLPNINDTTPNAFVFTDVAGATISTQYDSNYVEIGGMTAPSVISVVGGSYSINGGAFTTAPGTINPYDLVQARGISPSTVGPQTDVIVTIGGVSDTFSISTAASATVFNPTPQNGNVTYSNANKTVKLNYTGSAPNNGYGTVVTVASVPAASKKLFACTLDAFGTGNFACIGFRNATPPAGNISIGFDANGIGLYNNGAVFRNGSQVGASGPTWAQGNSLGIAVDSNLNVFWWTKDGSNFYGAAGTALTPAQVAAGVGGISLGVSGTLFGAVGEHDNWNFQWTILSAWPWTPPSGFSLL